MAGSADRSVEIILLGIDGQSLKTLLQKHGDV